MSAQVFDELVKMYSAYCEECDWQGDLFDTEGSAISDAERHDHLDCKGNDEDADPRSEREKFQDALDSAVAGEHL